MKISIALLLIHFALLAPPSAVRAAEIRVDSLQALEKAIAAASPGDRIIVADGRYVSNGTITVAAAGTKEQPIVITAETVGGVEIAGDGGFRLTRPAAYTGSAALSLRTRPAKWSSQPAFITVA